jgi:transposase
VPLPAYSPELNPVENLWHYLRSRYWANRIYADYAVLRHAAVDAWHKSVLNPAIIQSVWPPMLSALINRNWYYLIKNGLQKFFRRPLNFYS